MRKHQKMNYQSKKKSELIEIINHLKEKIDATTKEKWEWKNKFESILSNPDGYKNQMIESLHIKIDELEDENEEIKKELKDKKDLEKQIESLEEELDKLRDEYNNFIEKNEDNIMQITEPYQELLKALEGQFPLYSVLDNEIAYLAKEIERTVEEALKS